jgi:hypothetical protein
MGPARSRTTILSPLHLSASARAGEQTPTSDCAVPGDPSPPSRSRAAHRPPPHAGQVPAGAEFAERPGAVDGASMSSEKRESPEDAPGRGALRVIAASCSGPLGAGIRVIASGPAVLRSSSPDSRLSRISTTARSGSSVGGRGLRSDDENAWVVAISRARRTENFSSQISKTRSAHTFAPFERIPDPSQTRTH